MSSKLTDRRSLRAACSGVLLFAGLVICVSQPARATAVPTAPYFTGTEQNFHAQISGVGIAVEQGYGKILTNSFTLNPNPQTTSLSGLNPDTVDVFSDPVSMPKAAEITLDSATGNLLDIVDLNLDLLNGVSQSLEVDPFDITILINDVVPSKIDVLVSSVLNELEFHQTGPATINLLTSEYAVPGNFHAEFDNVQVSLLGGAIVLPAPSVVLDFPAVLPGTFTDTGYPNVSYSLDGNFKLALPVFNEILLAISQPSFSLFGTFDVQSTLNVALTYHLEDGPFLVPEPGTIVLLGFGLAGLLTVSYWRYSSRRCAGSARLKQ